MAFAQGSRSRLSYMVESTFGTTPATPVFLSLPINSHSLSLIKDGIESDEIRSDRQIALLRHGNRKVQGDIEVDMRADDYDDLLESAFFGQFTTAGVLKASTTPQYFSMEDGALDIAQYRLYTGCAVNTFSMSVKPNAIVKGTFGMIGKNMAQSGTSVDATITASSTNQPFDSFTAVLTEGGGASAIVTSLDLNIDNSLNPTFVVGASTTPQLEYGRAKVTGSMQVYYQDGTMLDKFLNETSSSLVIAVTDSTTGNTYTFTMGTIKYTGADVPLANEQSRIITMPFHALYNSSDATTIKVVKS